MGVFRVNPTTGDLESIPRPIRSTLEPLTVSPTGNPWVPISTLTEFQNMNATNNYYLTADIDGQGAVFNSPRTQLSHRRGWFDGRGHTIRNMVLGNGNGNGNAVFGSIACNNQEGQYTVQNVTLENINGNTTALTNVGILLGTSNWSATGTDPNNNLPINNVGNVRIRNITIKNCSLPFTNGTYAQGGRGAILNADPNGDNTLFEVTNVSVVNVTGVSVSISGVNNVAPRLVGPRYNIGYTVINNLFLDLNGLAPYDIPTVGRFTLTNAYLKDASYTGMTTVTDSDFTTPSTYSGFTFGNPWKMTADGPTPTDLGTWRLNAVKIALEPLIESPNDVPWLPVSNLDEFKAMDGTQYNYYLTADIDGMVDGTRTSWYPSYTQFSAGRKGWIDGRGHTIKNFLSISGGNGGTLLGSSVQCNLEGQYSLQNVVFENIQFGAGSNFGIFGVTNYYSFYDINNGQQVNNQPTRARNITFLNCQFTSPGSGQNGIFRGDSHGELYLNNISFIGCTFSQANGGRFSYNRIDHVTNLWWGNSTTVPFSLTGSTWDDCYCLDQTVTDFTTVSDPTDKDSFPTFTWGNDWQMTDDGPVAVAHSLPMRIWPSSPSYTLTFDPNTEDAVTGPDPEDKQVQQGHLYGELATISREGYYFNGWWTGTDSEEHGTGTHIYPSFYVGTISGPFSLYADWHDILTIVYDGSGAYPDPDNTEAPNGLPMGTIESMPTMTRMGYVFGGWYRQSDLQWTTEITNSTIADPTTTLLRARWGAEVTIQFSANGSVIASLTATYGQSLPYGSLPQLDPTEYGHTTFDGWEDSDGVTIDESSIVSGAGTLYAVWDLDPDLNQSFFLVSI